MRRILLIGLAFVVAAGSALADTGCSSATKNAPRTESGSSSRRVTLTGREAVRLFLSTVQRFDHQRTLVLEESVMPDAQSCSSFPEHAGNDLKERLIEVETVFRSMTQAKLTASLFQDLAKELRQISTDNSSLKAVAESATSVAANAAAKMENADVDLCRELAAWEETRWSDAFYNELLNAPFTRFGVDRAGYEKSIRTAALTTTQIQKIGGLQLEEALKIVSVVRYF